METKPEANVEVREIRLLVSSYYEIQKLRIQNSNRMKMLERDYEISEDQAKDYHETVIKALVVTEKDIEKRVRKYVRKQHIFARWIGPHVKGVAELLAGAMLSGIEDIGKFANVAKLWKYCGVGLNDDKSIQKRRRGEKINYSPFLKTACWKIGESFVKTGDRGYYGKMYAKYKADEVRKLTEQGFTILPAEEVKKKIEEAVKLDKNAAYQNLGLFSQGHVHNRAKRKTVKLFLSHLWTVWREMEDLPVTEPYIIANEPEKHSYYAPPGWDKEPTTTIIL